MSTSTRSSSSDVEAWKKLIGLIKETKFGMLTTATSDGTLRSRPMATQATNVDEVGQLWFFTSKQSRKVDEIEANSHVNLGYIGQGETLFISVAGTAMLVHDSQRMKQLWNPTLKGWFPDELNDPNIVLLKVTVTGAEYWSNTSNKLVQVYGYAKAALSGKPHTDEGQEHEKIDLSGRA